MKNTIFNTKKGLQSKVKKWIALGVAGVILANPILQSSFVTNTAAVTEEEAANLEKGIDVSGFNGPVDYEKVKKKGYTYVMMRAGSGKSFVDSQFADNYGNAGDAGLKRGVYYYSYATNVQEAEAEAANCLSILDKRNLECPVAYDIEEEATFASGNTTAIAMAFCEKIKNAGYEPMIYSSLNKLNEFFDYESISGYKIWIANYEVDYPDYPYTYWMWQYGIGNVPGANTGSGECDVNYIYNEFVPADAVSVSQETMALELGANRVNTGALQASVGPDNASNKHINWRSENDQIATVDGAGNVVGVANGTVNIIASSVNGVEKACAVTVTTPATGVSFEENEMVIGKKETVTPNPTLQPETSTDVTHYTSSDEKIVKANEDGTITGVKPGEATITATTDSGVSTTFTVTVKKEPSRVSTGWFIKKMKVGETAKLTAKLPKKSASHDMIYYSRNINRVDMDEEGNMKAISVGWCLVKAEAYNGKKSWKLIHVVE